MSRFIFNKISLLILLLFSGSVSFAQSSGCGSAQVLISGTSCTNTSFTLANGNSGTGSASCISNINDDGWFQFVANGSSTNILATGASNNIGMVVYSGNCSGLVEEACNDFGINTSAVTFTTVPGTTYYIRLIRTSNGGGNTTGDICIFSNGCSQITFLDEQFEGATPIQGAVLANIYGGGSWNNPPFILSGTRHGWFNTRNGFGPVSTVYDRQLTGLCVGTPVDISLWTRESYGGTNATYQVIDDLNNVLATTTLNLNGIFQQINFNFNATTPGMRFVITCNSFGGNGIDIVVEDILVTQCCPVVVLPEGDASVEAICTDAGTMIHWEVDQVEGIDEFILNRSVADGGFEVIGRLGSALRTDFEWLDMAGGPGLYQVLQKDQNGELRLLGAVHSECGWTEKLSVYPNPVGGQLVVRFSGELAHASIYSMHGVEVGRKVRVVSHGVGEVVLDVSDLAAGMYFLESAGQIVKFVKD